MPFDGVAYDPELDRERLTGQLLRVFDVMCDTVWRTTGEIHGEILARFDVDDPENSISAHYRSLRKQKFGGHLVERRRRGRGEDGCFEYRLVPWCRQIITEGVWDMAWTEMPEGVEALYFEMPWGDILLIHRDGYTGARHTYTHALASSRVESVLYALGQFQGVQEKQMMFNKMVLSGIIQRKP